MSKRNKINYKRRKKMRRKVKRMDLNWPEVLATITIEEIREANNMAIRLVSEEQIRFDVDVESYNRLIKDISNTVMERTIEYAQSIINNKISDTIVARIAESIDYNNVAGHMNYQRIIEYTKTHIISHLLEDERFKTLFQRGINVATIGFIDETVERVTTRIENQEGEV